MSRLKLILKFTSLIFVLIFKNLFAQEFVFQREVDTIPVIVNGETLQEPFSGGSDFTTPTLGDIDGDGDFDLFVGEFDGSINLYRNAGTATDAVFVLEQDFASIDVGNYSAPTLADIDNDGDLDLFVGEYAGKIYFYRNTGWATNPIFTLETTNYASIDVGLISTPTFADIDSDGDLDLFIGEAGDNINLYRNIGTVTNPSFVLENQNFVVEAFSTRMNPTFADIDNDGDLDLFIGRLGKISLYRNTGTPTSPIYTLETEDFASVDVYEESAPTFGDLDNDGDLDLLVGERYDGRVLWHENTGTATASTFVFKSAIIAYVDVGSNSAPIFTDLDNDGDLDLFLGEFAFGNINFYRNIGAASDPLFIFETANFANFDSIAIGSSVALAFADIDHDKDVDLFVGRDDGTISFYLNSGTPENPVFLLETQYFSNIDVGQRSAPAFTDIDNDGDFDLFIGETDGNLNFYRNTGSASNYVFTLETENFTSIDVGRMSKPTFIDIENDGDLDLFVGEEDGNIHFYLNSGTPENPVFLLGTQYFINIDVGLRSAPAFANIDSDGDFDLFVGEDDGGLHFYRNTRLGLKGDVNFDGVVNELDVDLIIDIIHERFTPTPEEFWAADFDDNGVVSISDAASANNQFLMNANIIVLSPNGGEIWQVGTSQSLVWEPSIAVTGVRVEISINSGETWSIISDSTENDGNEFWTPTSDFVSENCLFRISSVRAVSIADTSDNEFIITSSGGRIQRDPGVLTFNATEGGQNPASQILLISNSGVGALNWLVLSDSLWLSFSDTTGISTGETDTVLVNIDISVLSAGTHNAIITISAPGATNTPQTTSVTLNMTTELFTDISASLIPVSSSSVAWGDYDNDGDLDILLTGISGTTAKISKVYRNDDGNFVDISAGLEGVRSGSVAWGDYDNDGDLDIFLTGNTELDPQPGSLSRIYRNDDGSFVDVPVSIPGVTNSSVAWGDYDNDGDLDILVTGLSGEFPDFVRITKIYQNRTGDFIEIPTSLPNIDDGSVAWGDYDNDGDLDILLTGGTGFSSNPISKVYRNDNGVFVDIIASLIGVHASSVAWGDYDNDGDLDILLTGISGTQERVSKVYRNDNGNFVDILAPLIAVEFGSVAWGDYDNDGDFDILLTGISGTQERVSKTYRNDNGNFVDINAPLLAVERSSVAWGDYDNDGDLDILLTGLVDISSSEEISIIYENKIKTASTVPTMPTNLSSSVTENAATLNWNKSTDSQTTQNALTYNLRVGTTHVGNEITSSMADVNTGYRTISQLGNTNHNNSWTIRALPDGTYYWSVQAIDNAFAGSAFADEQSFVIGLSEPVPTISRSPSSMTFNATEEGSTPTSQRMQISNSGGGTLNWSVSGDSPWLSFSDTTGISTDETDTVLVNVDISGLSAGTHNATITISAAGATNTPQIASVTLVVTTSQFEPFTDISASLSGVSLSSVAWGDYDNDRDLDILLTGWNGTDEISRIYRNDDSRFIDILAPLADVSRSGVAWGDYDNDGDLDILLTGFSGGSLGPVISAIYNNDGGSFGDISAPLLQLHGGAVAWGDYDNDGDLDILLTGREAPPPPSITKIYRNDAGSFVDIMAPIVGVYRASVAWGDYDNDGDLDVLVSGIDSEQMPNTQLYRNDADHFVNVESSLPGVGDGAAAWGDYDDDGKLDILLTGDTGAGFIAKIYRNSGGSFFAIDSLPGVRNSSAAWGDYDNDGHMDILLSGDTGDGFISKVFRNLQGGFVDIGAGLPGVANGSVAWGDYDGDSNLDILLTGHTGSESISKVYRNNIETSNTVPTLPTSLTSSVSDSSVTISWNKATDSQTAQNALTYNLRLGTTPGGTEIISPMTDVGRGYRRIVALGNTNHNASWTIKNLPDGIYYWSVQAIDNAFAGSFFALEETFVIGGPAIELSITDTSAAPGETIDIPVRVSDAFSIAEAEIVVIYDPKILTALRAQTTVLTSGFTLVDSVSFGKIALSLSRTAGINNGSGSLLEIVFRVESSALESETSSVILQTADLFDENTNMIPVTTVNGRFTVSKPATVSVLSNPFTPNEDGFNDFVDFIFPESGNNQSEVQIFNMSGNRIKVLSNQDGRGFRWSGNDSDGNALEPGVYIYLIKANGNQIANGTITLIR